VRPLPFAPILTAIAALTAATALTLAHPTPARAQAAAQTPGSWRSVEVGSFLFHYPANLEGWTLDVARRIQDVEGRVAALVGHQPPERIQVVVDDPLSTSNGMAGPGPVIVLWPTPPGPRSMVGETRGWGEILAVHEYAHVAHLARPSRNPTRARLLRNAPLPLTPMMLGTPTWVAEGYATWVEGVLTGAGRPNGVSRPALFRTWALEGQFPSYSDLNGGNGFLSGAYPYLVGSAFLDWLLVREQRGADALQDLWARMTAVELRGFDEAFEGVFGAPAPVLYGRFTVDLTARALDARRAVEASGGFREGALFQQHEGGAGDPAVSPDGALMAYTRTSGDGSPELVLVRTSLDSLTTEEVERRARILERDPADVAAVERIPPLQEAVETLAPWGGIPFRLPRWMPDGSALLVIRDVELANGRLRPEAFLWSWQTGRLRQVTRSSGVREIDPAPEGTWGAAVRCDAGRCDLVRVDLRTGAVTLLAEGTFDAPFSRPRVSPDGARIVVEQPDGALWRLVAFDVLSDVAPGAPDGAPDGAAGTSGRDSPPSMRVSSPRVLGPTDGASRFDAAFLPGGDALVVVSTAGGLLNLERISAAPDLAASSAPAVTLTRTLGSAMAPAPAPDGSLFYLTFTPWGIDLLQLPAGDGPGGSPSGVQPIALPEGLFPMASPGRFQVPLFEEAPLPPSRPYGLGTLNASYLPMGAWSPEGWELGGVLQQMDPIGRLTVQLRGATGDPGQLRGGAIAGHLRLGGPSILAEAFLADQSRPEAPLGGGVRADRFPTPSGFLLVGMRPVQPLPGDPDALLGSVGAELGILARSGEDASSRAAWIRGDWGWQERLSTSKDRFLRLDGRGQFLAGSNSDGEGWTQWSASAGAGLALGTSSISAHGTVGGTGDTFQIGGTSPLLVDPRAVPEVVATPWLPAGSLNGRRFTRLGVEAGSVAGGFFAEMFRTGGGERARAVGFRIRETLDPMPFVRIPALELDGGSAWVTEPGAESGAFRSWLSFRVRP
jgi:hypothetical protein